MRKKRFVFGFVLILAFLTRLIVLNQFPAGFTADEAAQGYTAYSILKTGKDEWGVRLPIAPRSFGDFKPPLYTYLTVPSIAIFGLNEFGVRFPGVLIGTFAALATFLLVKELFGKPSLALFSSFFLAISPWHISLSRGAFEANLTTFLLPLGFYLFLKGLKKKKFLILAAFVLGLNLFSYHSARLVTPVFLGFLIWWRRQELFFRHVDHILIYDITALLAFFLFLIMAFGGLLIGGGTRVFDIGIFSAGLEAPKLFIDSYLSYLSPEFLFTQGAGEATYGMIPGIGVLYLFELSFLIIALVSLSRKWNRNFLPILAWITLAPIPAALSQGVGYHANRVAIMMPAIQIISAYGLYFFLSLISKYKKAIILLTSSIIMVSILSFLWSYFRHLPKISAPAMSYGWRETMAHLNEIDDKYQKIVVSRKFSEPQIFVAFYKKWEPKDFQKESQDWLRYEKGGLKFVDQLARYSLDKYEFRDINWNEDKNLKNVIFVGRDDDFPKDEYLTKKIIPYPDGQPAFLIIERP